jgi:hypothetical protein
MATTCSILMLLVGSASAIGPSGGDPMAGGAIPAWAHVPVVGAQAGPTGSASPSMTPLREVVATRVVVAAAGIDLAIISGDRKVPHQGPDMYPPCDVALYHTSFGQPGQGRTTYLYAHAREGMFLSLLTAAEHDDGASLIGARVDVYTSDDRLHVFTITLFKRHSTGFALVDDAPPGAEQLILQTSEGPPGTKPKLQVLALPVRVEDATDKASRPRAHPRGCYLG